MTHCSSDLTDITIGGTVFNYACERQANSCVRRRIIFTKPIKHGAMLAAMEKTRRRYPQLSLGLKKTKDHVFEVFNNEPFKLNRLNDEFSYIGQDTNGHMIAFYARDNELVIDFFHAIADDIGMDRFIQTLLYTYLTLLGHKLDNSDGRITTCETSYRPAEGENAGVQLLQNESHDWPNTQPRRAFKIRSHKRTLKEPDFAYILHVNLSDFKAYAKKHGATPAAVVSTLFSRILYRHYYADILPLIPPIASEIAVNLRSHFPTESVRNFVGNVYLTYDKALDRAEIDEALAAQSSSLRNQNTPEGQAAYYSHAFHMANRWFGESSLPVYMKNWAHKHIATRAMSGGMTFGISNIGKAQLPDCLAPFIAEYYSMVPAGLHSYLISMRSQGDNLTLCVTSKLLDSEEVVTQFAELLRRNDMATQLVSSEDLYYTKYVQNRAVTPAHQDKVDLSPAMDKILVAIDRASVTSRELRVAFHRGLA